MSAPGVEVVATIEEFGLDDEVVVSSLVVGRMVCCPPGVNPGMPGMLAAAFHSMKGLTLPPVDTPHVGASVFGV